MMPPNAPFYRQPWFLPVAILLFILVWLQLTPYGNNSNPASNSGYGKWSYFISILSLSYLIFIVRTVVNSISADQIKTLIASEVRDLMLNTEKVPLRDASSYPPVKKLPAAQALRILVTGGSGFVGMMIYICATAFSTEIHF